VAGSARIDERQAGHERLRSEELQFQCHPSRHGHTHGTWEQVWSLRAEDSSQKEVCAVEPGSRGFREMPQTT